MNTPTKPATPEFKKACEKAGIPETHRQLRKWNRKKGAAWKAAQSE